MSINIQQLILDAQKMANRNKELVALSNSLFVEAESNNRTLEAMKQFQDDMDSLNKLARNKSNSDMINRINQQNPSIRETRNENRELKATLEDHQRVLEMVMQKYREHTQQNLFKSQVNFKELYNEKLLEVIKKQAEKINEMAAVMQKAAQADDDDIYKEIEWNSKLKTENQALRELLQIANDFGSTATALRSGITTVTSSGVVLESCDGGGIDEDIRIDDDDKHNLLLLNSQIATSSTSSGYGTSSIATSIQSNRILSRPCEDKAIQTEFSQQQSNEIDNQQQQQSLKLTPNKSLDVNNENDDENSIKNENKEINYIGYMKTLNNQVIENGNSNNVINVKNNKISTIENNCENNINGKNSSNNNSPSKKEQQKQCNENNTTIKIKKENEENFINETNKNNITTQQQKQHQQHQQQINENIIKLTTQQQNENNFVENNDLSKLNLTNGTVDSFVENNDIIKQDNQHHDSKLNNSTITTTTAATTTTTTAAAVEAEIVAETVRTENQENNNKTTVSS